MRHKSDEHRDTCKYLFIYLMADTLRIMIDQITERTPNEDTIYNSA